ncbi:MAG TPA: DUF899 family protein, partial [Polyangiales bacterium]|nr:DUF899 family protein [Polyangiales bacterium]
MTARALPEIVSREAWLAARKQLLLREKEVTRLRDQVNAERRRLPMVEIKTSYVFEGPAGKLSFLDMFEGRRQLYVHHFMWIDSRDEGCPSCSLAADLNFGPRLREQLESRDITFVAISRAPFASIRRYKAAKGWTFPFYSSAGSSFNYDLHATLDESKAPIEYNYQTKAELLQRGVPEALLHGDMPVNSVFLRDGDRVFHCYSASARG